MTDFISSTEINPYGIDKITLTHDILFKVFISLNKIPL